MRSGAFFIWGFSNSVLCDMILVSIRGGLLQCREIGKNGLRRLLSAL